MRPPDFLFCFTVLVVERSPLVVPDLLEIGSATRLKIVPLGDATLLPFWAYTDSNFTGGVSFPGALLTIGDGEGRHISTRERFLLDLFLSFSSCFP